MRDQQVIKDLSVMCRPLVIILCSGYCIIVIILVVALAVKNSNPPKPNNFQIISEVNYAVLLALSFVAVIFCALFITATFIRSMWLSLPYLIFHGIILIFGLYLFIEYMIWIEYYYPVIASSDSFGYHIFWGNGAYVAFMSVLACSLLLYTWLPLGKFVNECRLLRAERIQMNRGQAFQTMSMMNQSGGVILSRSNLPSISSRNEFRPYEGSDSHSRRQSRTYSHHRRSHEERRRRDRARSKT